MPETIVDVRWEGPFKWGEHKDKLNDCHVLYAVYGAHPVYGPNVLLYIGMTKAINDRMQIHDDWIQEEYEIVSIRVASMGKINSWAGWDEKVPYPKADPDDVKMVESLLIYAHQPVYNRANKDSIRKSGGIRIFNTGKIGPLLPEVSYRYYNEDGEW